MPLTWLGATVGLTRFALRRVRADLPALVLAGLVLTAATSLVASSVQYSDAVAIAGLQRAILDGPPTARGISVETTAQPGQVAAFDGLVAGTLSRALGPGAPVVLVARSASLAPFGLPSDQAALHLTVLGGYPNLDQHARLTSGSWPVAGHSPVQATLSTAAAKALGLAVGDQLGLVDASVPGTSTTPLLTVVVTGTWTTDPDDPYWLGDPLDLDGIVDQGSLAYRGPFMVAPSDLLSRGLVAHLDLTWRAGPSGRIVPADLGRLESALPAIAPSLAAGLPPRQPLNVSAGLAPLLAGLSQGLALAQGGVTLLILQFVVLAAFAVILVAALLADRRRREHRMLQARGASSFQVLLIATGEAVLVTLPAVLLAPLVAAGAVQVLAVAGPLAGAGVELPVSVSGATLLAAALSGLVCVGVLVAPWVPTGRRISALRLAIDRERSHVAAQRFGIDIALLLVAGLALWQLRLYGSPVIRNAGGELGIDPLLVAGPAVAMAAVSLLAARALPRLAGIAEWILVRRRNLVPQLGAHDLARRPLRSIRSTLLIMLAAALTTFAVVYDATWLHSQADQAAYQAAADIRVVTPSYAKVEAPFLGPTYRAIAGVTAASPVLRQNVDIGGSLRTADLLALDAVRSPAMIGPGEPDTSAGIPFAALAAGRPALPGIELPGRPVRLEVNVDAALTSLTVEGFVGPGDEVVPAPQGLSVSALVVDGDGQVRRFDAAAPAAFEGASETLEIPLQSNPLAPAEGAVDRLATPLHLISLEIQLTPAIAITNTTGSLEVRRVQVSDSPAGDSWTVVPFDPGAAGWSWLRQDASGETPYLPPAGQASLIRVDAGAPIQGDVYQDSPTVFRAAASPGASLVVGAIASSAFLAATGDRVGDSITGSINGDAIPFRIVGQADDVPSLDPSQPFLVVDGPTLNLADYFANGTSLPVSEWWLSVAPGDSSAVARQLAAPPLSATTIVSREAIQASLLGDPVALGVVGALLLGAISAVIFAGLGFLVSASASIEARAAEFGLLRAIGLTDSQLVRWLAVEQGILLAVGVSAGSVLGAAIAWVVLPAVSFTPSGAAPVPAAVLIVPWPALGAIAAGSLGLLGATILLAHRRLARISVAATLRAGVE